MVDSIYQTIGPLGVAAEGFRDQYADGRAAKVWEYYIGSRKTRTEQYRQWIVNLLKRKEVRHVMDVACGTGVDSILLLEEGFNVTSTDASDRMLKYALKERWNRRKESVFDNWVIEEANWLTLIEDIASVPSKPSEGFDAVVCLGNSFAHLPDFEGNQAKQKTALMNFHEMVKPGGILIIDHRNYDEILKTGVVPAKNIYCNSEHVTDIRCSNLYVNGKAILTTLDYVMDIPVQSAIDTNTDHVRHNINTETFRLSYYPHFISDFTSLLHQVFGTDAVHEIYADFKLVEEVECPAYYIHVIQKMA